MHPSNRFGKRRFPRAAIESTAKVSVGHDNYQATVKQISEGGLRLESERELPNVQLALVFDLPGFGEQRVVSEICWQREAPRGYGLRFKDVQQGTVSSIASYVTKMKHAYAELQLSLALGKPRALFASLLREVKLDHLTDELHLRVTVDRAMEQLRTPNT